MVNFIVKWAINGVIVTLLMMWFSDADFWEAALTATILTVIAYIIGDQWVLRTTNNTIATIVDFLLAVVYLLIAEYIFDWGLNFGEILIISALVGIAEFCFHRYFLQDEGTTAS
ncbi:DUF2512 family protein [Paenibacillus humicola]|uniref:DUF2512 family protein n=1 Tax=Paenibacillus humicola TaxID=3110540 RepID=UPI00237B487B|nr:DUF2512 family protein [Paenibacillus humicola]